MIEEAWLLFLKVFSTLMHTYSEYNIGNSHVLDLNDRGDFVERKFILGTIAKPKHFYLSAVGTAGIH